MRTHRPTEPDPALPTLPFPCDEPLRALARELHDKLNRAALARLRGVVADEPLPVVLRAS